MTVLPLFADDTRRRSCHNPLPPIRAKKRAGFPNGFSIFLVKNLFPGSRRKAATTAADGDRQPFAGLQRSGSSPREKDFCRRPGVLRRCKNRLLYLHATFGRELRAKKQKTHCLDACYPLAPSRETLPFQKTGRRRILRPVSLRPPSCVAALPPSPPSTSSAWHPPKPRRSLRTPRRERQHDVIRIRLWRAVRTRSSSSDAATVKMADAGSFHSRRRAFTAGWGNPLPIVRVTGRCQFAPAMLVRH